MLAQRAHAADPNFYDESYYVHDRLGSVRMVVDTNDIDATVFVANSYTYTPFGSHYDGDGPDETADNPWQFTGQYRQPYKQLYQYQKKHFAQTFSNVRICRVQRDALKPNGTRLSNSEKSLS